LVFCLQVPEQGVVFCWNPLASHVLWAVSFQT
jgi:hypothetical protein